MRVALRVYARCFRSFYDFLVLLHVTFGNVVYVRAMLCYE